MRWWTISLCSGPALDSISTVFAFNSLHSGSRGEAGATWDLLTALCQWAPAAASPIALGMLWLSWWLGDAHLQVSCQGVTTEHITPLMPEHKDKGALKLCFSPSGLRREEPCGLDLLESPMEPSSRVQAKPQLLLNLASGVTSCYFLWLPGEQWLPPAHCCAVAAGQCPSTACCQIHIIWQHLICI